MLHEILLSLAGHPSPLLRAGHDAPYGRSIISPPERELLASVAHLSDLHVKLLSATAQISTSHSSMICRAVASAMESVHLHAFQQKVVEVEDMILRKDAGLVGAYNIVPLTAVVGEFAGWTRRMEWLWEMAQLMMRKRERGEGEKAVPCTASRLIDRLRSELQTGYVDVEDTARTLVRAAEVAWLKQVSTWILYGRLPSFGVGDFFVQKSDGEQEYVCIPSLLPCFVTPATAASMLFIGSSLVHIRTRSGLDQRLQGNDHLSSQLRELSKLSYPLESAAFSRTVSNIRQFLSKTTLQRLLPLAKIMDMLQLLRDFFLLGRGEFAMALTQQADEKIRTRWKRADNLAYEKREGVAKVVVKEGEVSAVLAATWAALGSMQGQHSDEDEGIEAARDLLRLNLASQKKLATPVKPIAGSISSTPFRNLLFSVPVTLGLDIPSPLDLFLSQADLQTYTTINSYLLSLRRAHIRLTDLWKVSALRRHHPPPPGPPHGSSRNGRAKVVLLRKRHIARSNTMRSAWVTASAAIFFLAETEGYLQTEVVAGLWDGFQRWLKKGHGESRHDESSRSTRAPPTPLADRSKTEEPDIWLVAADQADLETTPSQGDAASAEPHHQHDPETLANAHRLYMSTLTHRLLLTQQTFTDALYELLVQIDQLIALVHRLHGIWNSMDLEADVGVVDAFVDLEREEHDVKGEMASVEGRVRTGVESVVGILRALVGSAFLDEETGLVEVDEDGTDIHVREAGAYVPHRVGGLDRLLMKLDFGTWFDSGGADCSD